MRGFRDRIDAGRRLARELKRYANRPDVIVLALPRGGVPVAVEVARELGSALDVLVVRKLGVPGHEELAMGAIATGGVMVLNDDVVTGRHISRETLEAVAGIERVELARRERAFRGDRPAPEIAGRTVILVDDGLATGATMHAAVAAMRQMGAGQVVVAVPVAAPSVREEFSRDADEIVCLETPEPFLAVGLWYEDFSQTTDNEVAALLAAHAEPVGTERGLLQDFHSSE